MHIKNIYNDEELEEEATSKENLLVQKEGTSNVKRNIRKLWKISHKQEIDKTNNEYEKFRVKQDMEYISSMDEMYKKYLEENKKMKKGDLLK